MNRTRKVVWEFHEFCLFFRVGWQFHKNFELFLWFLSCQPFRTLANDSPEAIWWLACSVYQRIVWNIIWMLLLFWWWRRRWRAGDRRSRWIWVRLGGGVVDDLLRQVELVAFLVIALDGIVVVAEVGDEVAVVGVNVPSIGSVLGNDVGTHLVGVLNVHLFHLLLLFVLLLERLPQVPLVKVLVRCLRRFDDLINRFLWA